MPPAAAAAIPAMGWAGIGLGGASLLDNLFGSGAQARDQQQQALDQQNALAQAQLPDIQRRTELNQWLQDTLQNQYASPNVPSEFLDLDSVFQQYYPDKQLLDNDMFSRISPGIQRKQAFDQLQGLGGNVGTGGIHSQAQLASSIGESRRGEFSDNISQIVGMLLQQMGQGANDPGSMPSRGMFGQPDFSGVIPPAAPSVIPPQTVGGPPPIGLF